MGFMVSNTDTNLSNVGITSREIGDSEYIQETSNDSNTYSEYGSTHSCPNTDIYIWH